MKIFHKLSIIKPFIDICIHPENTENVLKIQRAINNIATDKQKKKVVEHIKKVAPSLLMERHVLKVPKELRDTSPRTLGRDVFWFYNKLGNYNLHVYSKPKDDFEFITNDFWESGHNLTHVLCDFNTEVEGEMGTYGFLNSQYPSQMSVILTTIPLFNSLLHMKKLEKRIENFVRGWNTGKKAKSIVGVNWNKYWDIPLTEVREEFNINPRGLHGI